MLRRRSSLLSKMLRSHDAFYGDEFWWRVEPVFGEGGPKRIIEFACGPGLFAKDVLERFPVQTYTLTDISQKMLRHARRILEEAQTAAGVSIVRRDFDAGDWDIKEHAYDIAFIGLSFRNIAEPGAFLNKVRSVLAERGRIVIYDFLRVPYEEFAAAWAEYVGVENKQANSVETVAERFGNFCRHSKNEVQELLRQSRYTLRTMHTITTPMPLYVAVASPASDLQGV